MDDLEKVRILHCSGVFSYNHTDRPPQTKSEYANEAAIADDAAAQAYVEQFAQETLDRAERVIRANRVTQYA
jgi:vacuolar protein sorting-associated protein VTA1